MEITERVSTGKFTLPPPSWLVVDADGNSAVVRNWTHLSAYKAGQRLLQDNLEKLPAPPLAVTPMTEGAPK